MAITHVKVTYSVQPRTAQRVAELATKWGVPKSEVIRRAVEEAWREEAVSPKLTPREALAELMARPLLTRKEAEQLNREIRLSRRASSRKRDAMLKEAWEGPGPNRSKAVTKQGA